MANKPIIPIPRDPIGESFVWRDWFQKLSNTVYGTIATQDANNVNITGGTISNINFTGVVITKSTIDSTPIGNNSASTGRFTSIKLDTALAVAYGGTGVKTTTANYVFAGPTTGAAAAPSFRALVVADIPALPYGTGDVVGPASATDNAIARFDSTTGKLIQNSVVTISDTGATTGVTTLSASTSVTTPIVQAANSAGLSLKNASGTTQMSVGAGGGDNMSVNVSTNLNGTNAQIDISPTGTGHVHIKPTGTGSVEVAPTNVGTIDNMTIGATTPSTGVFTTLTGGGGSANFFQTQGAATTNAVEVKALGSDTNIAFVIDSKGTGAIDLAAGSRGVNISNGGTVTAITRTGNGSGYTSIPAVAISAPTTAGGVQATASVANMQALTATVNAGGTGYTLNDVVTISGGTPVTVAATFTVTGVSGGVVTAVTILNFAPYSVLPTAPVSVTGGTGTGLTLTNLTWAIGATFTITNAGSGYVEQPTVTFSGGGGSGAAAYATVGGTSKITGIGAQTDLYTPSGAILSTLDGGLAGTGAYLQLTNSSASNSINRVIGSGTNLGVYWLTKGTGPHAFATANSVSTVQFNVAHTASAVNYVQVTGAATAVPPVISAQGSDTNVHLTLLSKGSNGIRLSTAGASNIQAFVSHTASAVNFLQLTGAAAGASPTFSVAGTDTNIDLALTPKGTGNVRFGTYTGTALSIAGYIEIKDSGGTVRKLAVVA